MSKTLKLFLSILSVLLCWEFFTVSLKLPDYLLPSPLKVFEAFRGNFGIILENGLVTLTEAFLGFIVANILSVGIALTIGSKRSLEDFVLPVAIILKTIPIIALTPLLIIWFGSGIASRIATAGLICFFPSLVTVLRGIKSIEISYLELFQVLSASRFKTVTLLMIPSVLPYLFSALKVSSSLAIVGALVGEFISSNKGLGFLIIVNYYNLNIALVFAALIVSSLSGIVFYYLINLVEEKLIFWTNRIE